MRIFSDFHDYYDVGMRNGIDPKLPYQRFRREEPVVISADGRDNRWGWWYRRYEFRVVFIGFAGKVYPAFVRLESPNAPSYLFDLDQLETADYQEMFDNLYSGRFWGRSVRREKDWKEFVKETRETLDELFAYREKYELTNLFEKYRTAIFVYRIGDKQVQINAPLSPYGFQRVLPPLVAFQELAMYVGNYLTQPVIEEPPITDRVKAEIHGFDKHSFRKEKQH
ncbi:MAG: hypothetical protein ACRC46_05540 [Thermoguttaceae bacterium]